MPCQVRPFQADDWELFRSLRLRSLADAPDSFRPTLAEEQAMSDDEWIDLVASTVDHPRGLLLVADQAGDAVGLMFARVSEDGITTHVGAMWVEPHARGEGVGRELLGEALSWGRSLGSTRAELWVTAGNDLAERFYAAAGFEPTGQTDALREGSHLTVVALSRDL